MALGKASLAIRRAYSALRAADIGSVLDAVAKPG
jgi:hypothetical protein